MLRRCWYSINQWRRHDRRDSAVVPSLIAVATRKTVKTADLRGGTAETLNMVKTSAVPPRVGPIRSRRKRKATLPRRDKRTVQRTTRLGEGLDRRENEGRAIQRQ